MRSSSSIMSTTLRTHITEGIPSTKHREINTRVGGRDCSEETITCTLLGDGMVGKTSLPVGYLQHGIKEDYTATVLDQITVPVVVAGKEFQLNVYDTAGQSDYEALRVYTYASSEVLLLCFNVCDRQSFDSLLLHWLPEVRRHLSKQTTPILLVGTQADRRAKNQMQQHRHYSVHSAQVHRSQEGHKSHHSEHVRKSRYTSSHQGLHKVDGNYIQHSHDHHHHRHYENTHRHLHHSHYVEVKDEDEVTPEEGRKMADTIGADCYLECSALKHEDLRELFKHVVLSAVRRRYNNKDNTTTTTNNNNTNTRTTPTTSSTGSIDSVDGSDNNDLTSSDRFFRSRQGSNVSSVSSRKWSAGRFFGRLFERSSFRLSTRKVGQHKSMPSLFTTLAA